MSALRFTQTISQAIHFMLVAHVRRLGESRT
jgi:hypothetical protein